MNHIAVIIEEYHYYQRHTKCYPTLFSPDYLHVYKKLLGISVDFGIIDQLLIRYSAITRY
jgi:hypothetical protein